MQVKYVISNVKIFSIYSMYVGNSLGGAGIVVLSYNKIEAEASL